MSKYIDGFVLPLPKDKIEDYRKIAAKAGAIWKEHGALEYVESVLDDPESMDMIPFPRLANADAEETVVFAWIVFRSREQRDAVNRRVMEDPRMKEMMKLDSGSFDYTRMAYGGFTTLVSI